MAIQYARRRGCNHWIPPEHLRAILTALRPEDRQICIALYCTGFRVDDLLSARVGAIADGKCTLIERKTGKRRSIAGEGMKQVERIGDYTRGRRMDQRSDYLIPARRVRSDGCPRHLSRSTIWRAFTRAVRESGLMGYGYTVHSLRKCYAVDIFQCTHSIEATQQALGHDRPSTTLIYISDYLEGCARSFPPITSAITS